MKKVYPSGYWSSFVQKQELMYDYEFVKLYIYWLEKDSKLRQGTGRTSKKDI